MTKMLVSPAAIDLGGVCIFPQEEDFNRITKDQIKDIFTEVFIDKKKFEVLMLNLETIFWDYCC